MFWLLDFNLLCWGAREIWHPRRGGHRNEPECTTQHAKKRNDRKSEVENFDKELPSFQTTQNAWMANWYLHNPRNQVLGCMGSYIYIYIFVYLYRDREQTPNFDYAEASFHISHDSHTLNQTLTSFEGCAGWVFLALFAGQKWMKLRQILKEATKRCSIAAQTNKITSRDLLVQSVLQGECVSRISTTTVPHVKPMLPSTDQSNARFMPAMKKKEEKEPFCSFFKFWHPLRSSKMKHFLTLLMAHCCEEDKKDKKDKKDDKDKKDKKDKKEEETLYTLSIL